MIGPAPVKGSYTWDRSFRLWDTYFALIWLATLVFVPAVFAAIHGRRGHAAPDSTPAHAS